MNQPETHLTITNLYLAFTEVQAALDKALAAGGSSTAQWGILGILQKYPGASGADIARYARVTPASVATMLQRLEKAGLITRSAAQGRVIGTYLTPAGQASLITGDRIAAAIEAKFFIAFMPDEKQQFNQFLKRFIPDP